MVLGKLKQIDPISLRLIDLVLARVFQLSHFQFLDGNLMNKMPLVYSP